MRENNQKDFILKTCKQFEDWNKKNSEYILSALYEAAPFSEKEKKVYH